MSVKSSTSFAFLQAQNTLHSNFDPHSHFPRNTRASTYKSLSTVTEPGVMKPAGQLPVSRFLFLEPTSFRAVARKRPLLCLREKQRDAIGSGIADALFVRSLVEESKLFQKSNIFVITDSNIGKSIVSRFGASRRTKHVHLRFLYVQELVVSGMVRVRKVLGALNPADILTKYVPKDSLNRHLPAFGFREQTERESERVFFCFVFCFRRALRYFRVHSCSADMSVMYTLLADMCTCSLCSACLVIVCAG